MRYNWTFDNSSDALPILMSDLLDAQETGSRDGRTLERTHVGITLIKPWQRELLVEGRKANLAAQIAETMWVLAGRGDIEWLSHYLPRASQFSDDGKVWRAAYGPRLRSWVGGGKRTLTDAMSLVPIPGVDQLDYVIRTLQSSSLSRQAVISLWDPEVDTRPGKDIACNNWLSFSNRLGYLDLHVAIRSNDAMWGWSSINAFEWSALQEVIAGMIGVNVGQLHFSVTSFHLYERHWGKARELTQAEVHEANDSPRFKVPTTGGWTLDSLTRMWFNIEGDIRTGSPCVDAVNTFPEPMFQSWLRVLQWWWSGDLHYLTPLAGTRLERAAALSVQPPDRTKPTAPPWALAARVAALHAEKHAAYGDSWKKRGELLSILPNIARKVDRLVAGTTTNDEQLADTAQDLLVYLAKYRWWLADEGAAPAPLPYDGNGEVDRVRALLLWAEQQGRASTTHGEKVGWLDHKFNELAEQIVTEGCWDASRSVLVDQMLVVAYAIAAGLDKP